MKTKAVQLLVAVLAGFLAAAPASAAPAIPAPQGLPALSGDPGLALSGELSPAGGPVVVGDRSSLSRLAVQNSDAPRGLTAVAVDAVAGLSGLRPSSSTLRFSPEVTLPSGLPDVYAKTIDMVERYQIVTQALPRTVTVSTANLGEESLRLGAALPALNGASQSQLQPWLASRAQAWLATAEAISPSIALAGLQLTGRAVPEEEINPEAGPGAHQTGAYDLVATMPLVPEKVDVSAHYRLVDLDRLAGAAAAADGNTPQTMGIGGKIALNEGALLKAGYEVTRQNGAVASTRTDAGVTLRLDPRTDLSAGLTFDRPAAGAPSSSPSTPLASATPPSLVRTSFGLGYQLNSDAALRASYTLINFGTRPSPSQASHEASAELSLRF